MVNQIFPFNSKGFHFTHFVRSPWHKHTSIEKFLKNNNKITALGLSETWLINDHVNNIIEITASNLFVMTVNGMIGNPLTPKKAVVYVVMSEMIK